MSNKIKIFITNYWILIIAILVKFILQYVVVNPIYELHRDEFLHLNQSDHLAFGYISVPPLTAVFAKLIFFLGGSLFWIRFFPALFGALTIIFAWKIVEALNGGLISKILITGAMVFSVLVRLNILFQPNSFDVLAWTVLFFIIIRYAQSENPKWLYYFAMMTAIGLYNKYTVVFLLSGLFIGLLLTHQRKIFSTASFWKAILLALILFSPNIIWQIANNFPVKHHMEVLKATQLVNNTVSDFLFMQIIISLGSLALGLASILSFFFYKPFKKYQFLGIAIVAIMVLYCILKAKAYYSIGIYPVMFAFGAVFFDKALSTRWRLIVVPLLVIFNLSVFFLTFKFVNPILAPLEIISNRASFERIGLLRWEDGVNHELPQDFADMTGWREMSEKALEAYKMIPKNELKYTLIFCDNYGQTGALNYYNRKKMPQAYSYNTDYIYWMPQLDTIKNIVVVGREPDQHARSLFKECTLTGIVENPYAREKGTGIYLLIGADSTVTKVINQEIKERIRNFDIF